MLLQPLMLCRSARSVWCRRQYPRASDQLSSSATRQKVLPSLVSCRAGAGELSPQHCPYATRKSQMFSHTMGSLPASALPFQRPRPPLHLPPSTRPPGPSHKPPSWPERLSTPSFPPTCSLNAPPTFLHFLSPPSRCPILVGSLPISSPAPLLALNNGRECSPSTCHVPLAH